MSEPRRRPALRPRPGSRSVGRCRGPGRHDPTDRSETVTELGTYRRCRRGGRASWGRLGGTDQHRLGSRVRSGDAASPAERDRRGTVGKLTQADRPAVRVGGGERVARVAHRWLRWRCHRPGRCRVPLGGGLGGCDRHRPLRRHGDDQLVGALAEPRAGRRILRELRRHLDDVGVGRVADLVGGAEPW